MNTAELNPELLAENLAAFRRAVQGRLHSMQDRLGFAIGCIQETKPEKAAGYRVAVLLLEEALADLEAGRLGRKKGGVPMDREKKKTP